TSTANTTVRPGANANGETSTANTTVRPGANANGETSTANTTVRPGATPRGETGTANTTVDTGAAGQPLTCRLQIARLPRNGYVVIEGTGFVPETTVKIGGVLAQIRGAVQPERISARVSRSGTVVVYRGDERATCGPITVIN
ncbi:MAG: hypothetical protein CMN30_00815, partial [Sandaracinus sp.]|nr:hypothetical protein [Sandaracinus sp.]